MKIGSIYIIKNTVNSKVYIGQTTMTVHERFMSHMKPSIHKKRASYKIYNAINKYGADKFYYEILETNVDVSEINNKEIYYIDKYDSFNYGYNSTTGGDGRIICKIEDENELIQMYNEGKNREYMANYFKVDKTTITRTLHKLGIRLKEKISKKDLEKCDSENMSNIDIAKKFNVHNDTVYRARTKYNMRVNNKEAGKREYFDFESFRMDYKNNSAKNYMLSKYRLSNSAYYRLVKKMDLKR